MNGGLIVAIGFARLEYVKRANGKVSCAKAAYNSRSKMHFEGNEFMPSKTYDWSSKEKPIHHEVILPSWVDEKFKDMETLWNLVEQTEVRKNSVVAMEIVLALPDDEVISLQDKISMSKSFIDQHLTKKGYAVQFDIHQPDKNSTFSKDTGELEEKNHNWHAHLLVTTRRFSESGIDFEKNKPREDLTVIRGGKVISGPKWGELWTHHQNEYFEERGIDLRVTPNGIVSQVHLGPVRMRGRAYEVLFEHNNREELNSELCKDPSKILEKITETKSVFTKEDFESFLNRYVDAEFREDVKQKFWSLHEITQLWDANEKNALQLFTTTKIVEEEKKIVRLSELLSQKEGHKVDVSLVLREAQFLNEEQKKAFESIVNGKAISFVEGHAGTGKSYLLFALSKVYSDSGLTVRALGPDNATAYVLKEKGLSNPENLYRFLFSEHYGSAAIKKGKEVWLIDEAGKIGNRPLLELLKVAKNNDIQVVFSGNSAQLSSVDRGGMFGVLCEKFGHEILSDVQRQKNGLLLDAAKKLAVGEVAESFDIIHSTGGFKWYSSKAKAIEAAVHQWHQEKTYFPNASALIIAHTNAEVGALNEMVRSYRKLNNELGTVDYRCLTNNGIVYISEGDIIEFRKKDKEINVTNGLSGIVKNVSEDKFTVIVSEQGKKREVSFNPKLYNNFQLGYATTYYRSQGRTIDRAYIIHSPKMNKELFYVGLTRHVRNVTCFVSKEDASCLTELKLQAMKKSDRLNTNKYTTEKEIAQREALQKKEEHLKNLKNSNSMFDRARGHAFEAFSWVRNRVGETVERNTSYSPDKKFFSPDLSTNNRPGEVRLAEEKYDIHTKHTLSDVAGTPEVSLRSEEDKPRKGWSRLTNEQQSLLKKYFSHCDETATLYSLVMADIDRKGVDKKSVTTYPQWQKSCSERNAIANEVLGKLSGKELEGTMSSVSIDILNDRAQKHRDSISTKETIEDKLRKNLDPLIYRLFPEGPTRRGGNDLRFGSKGSLSVKISGDKTGAFWDFEKGFGGGLIKLIERVHGVDKDSAIKWANEFLGEASKIEVPKSLHFRENVIQKRDDWIAIQPKPECRIPSLETLSKNLAKTHVIEDVYPYKDADGKDLFYTLRIVNKANPKEKQVLPLSFGHYKGGDGKDRWSFRRFSQSINPLFNQHFLKEHPNVPVLVVEGEKAAKAGQDLFGDSIVCVTWMGGAKSVKTADWSPLFYRDVVIWPDNDKAGFEAAEDVSNHLKRVGVKSLKIVDKELIQSNFPEKWDIADSLPNGKDKKFIKDCILRANENSVGLERFSGMIEKTMTPESAAQKLSSINEVLYRVDQEIRNKSQGEDIPLKVFNERIYKEALAVIREDGGAASKDQSSKQGKSMSINSTLSVTKTLERESQIQI